MGDLLIVSAGDKKLERLLRKETISPYSRIPSKGEMEARPSSCPRSKKLEELPGGPLGG